MSINCLTSAAGKDNWRALYWSLYCCPVGTGQVCDGGGGDGVNKTSTHAKN
jgi:hypothetical protein